MSAVEVRVIEATTDASGLEASVVVQFRKADQEWKDPVTLRVIPGEPEKCDTLKLSTGRF